MSKLNKPSINNTVLWAFLLSIILLLLPYDLLFRLPGKIHYPFNSTFQSHSDLAQSYADFAQFIGGITAPILGMFSIYLIYKTYMSQKEELSETKKQLQDQTVLMRKERFESVFFQLLNTFASVSQNIKLSWRGASMMGMPPSETIGASAIFKDKIFPYIKSSYKGIQDNNELNKTNGAFKLTNQEYGDLISQYMANLLTLIEYVKNETSINHELNKDFYISLIKAQLSSYESSYLIYYMTHFKDNSLRKFVWEEKFIESYGKTDDTFIDPIHKDLFESWLNG